MDSSLSIETEAFKLSAAIDSSDSIYRVQLEPREASYEKIGSALKARALERKISDVLKMGTKEFSTEGLEMERALYALKLLIKKFQGSDIYSAETRDVDLSKLVCRCNFLDAPKLEAAFNEAKGDFKKALLATNASMICSACSSDVKTVYDSMSFEELDKKREAARLKVQEALGEFSLFCPPEYERIEFIVASVKNDVVKIKVLGDRGDLSRPQITETLRNFLTDESTGGMDISVFF